MTTFLDDDGMIISLMTDDELIDDEAAAAKAKLGFIKCIYSLNAPPSYYPSLCLLCGEKMKWIISISSSSHHQPHHHQPHHLQRRILPLGVSYIYTAA